MDSYIPVVIYYSVLHKHSVVS